MKRTDEAIGLIRRLAARFHAQRLESLVEHPLIGQRLFGLALGYEGLNDHDELRSDPLFGALMRKLQAKRKVCKALAGKSTLNPPGALSAGGMFAVS